MHKQWQTLLPYYVTGRLPVPARLALEEHLSSCRQCSAALDEWRAIAEAVRTEASARLTELPPLDPQLYRVRQDSAAQMPSTSSDRRSSSRKWNVQEFVTILKPANGNEENSEMYTTNDDAVVPARPAQYSGTRTRMFDPLTWAAAIAAMLIVGAMLLAMYLATRPGEPGVPEALPLAVQQETCDASIDHMEVGRTFFDSGDYETAIEEFTCAIEADPDNPGAYLARGEAHLLIGDLSEVFLDYVRVGDPERIELTITRYSRAIDANPDDVTAYVLRAGAYLITWADASLLEADCSRIVELDTELGFGHLCLGIAYLSAGQAQQAQDEFEIALERAPDNPGIAAMVGFIYTLGFTYLDLDMEALALEHLSRAIQLDPEQGIYYALRAYIYHKTGESSLAAADLAQAVELAQSESIVRDVEMNQLTTLPLPAGRVYSIPLQAEAGQRVTISAWPQGEFLPVLMVLVAEDGTPLIGGFVESESTTTRIYEYALPADGTYTVLVTDAIPVPEAVVRLRMTLND